MKETMKYLGVVLVLAFAACGTSDKSNLGPAAQNQEGSGSSGSDLTGCPRELMGLMQDVTVTMNDTPTGIAVDFVTSATDKVDALRLAVRHMVEMHTTAGGDGTMGGMGGGMGGMDGGHMGGTGSGTGSCNHGSMDGGMMTGSGCMGSIFANATVEVQDIDGGARVVFTATSADKLDALRVAVRSHFETMATGRCPMM